MEIIDWITLAVFFILGFWLGDKWATAVHLKAFTMILDQLQVKSSDFKKLASANGIDLPEESTADSDMDEYEITVEKHGDQLYAFKLDGEFIGQGTDRDTLVARIAERYTNVRFTVAEGKEYLTKD